VLFSKKKIPILKRFIVVLQIYNLKMSWNVCQKTMESKRCKYGRTSLKEMTILADLLRHFQISIVYTFDRCLDIKLSHNS